MSKPLNDSARRVIRTIFQFVMSAAVLLLAIGDQLQAEFPSLAPWLVAATAVAGALTRLMALPAVEAFLERWAPWLAAYDRDIDTQAWTSDIRPASK